MDPESERELGQPGDQRWDRGVHARLLDQLRAAGARAVVFDVWFDGASDPPRDQALVEALRRFPRTALAGRLVKVVRLGVFDEEILEGPTPELAAAARWGVSYFNHRLDQIIRRPYPGRADKPHLAVEAARIVQGDSVQPPRGVWLNYYGPAGIFESYSYAQVLTNQVPADRFADQRVCMKRSTEFCAPGGHESHGFGEIVLAHQGLKIGQRLLMRPGLAAPPVHVEADHQSSEQAHDQQPVAVADPAPVIVERHVESLVTPVFDSPAGPVGRQPLGGREFLRPQVRDQPDLLVLSALPLPEHTGALGREGKADLLGRYRTADQGADLRNSPVLLDRPSLGAARG